MAKVAIESHPRFEAYTKRPSAVTAISDALLLPVYVSGSADRTCNGAGLPVATSKRYAVTVESSSLIT